MSKSGDQLNGVLGELIGLHAHQQEYNDQGLYWRVRVEFANAGQDFRSASYAAQMIEERAKKDKSVAAVIGLAWSREETRRAITTLGRAQLPMLSTTNTADITPKVNRGLPSPYFFRMAAPNSAQAQAMVWWLSEGLLNGRSKISPTKVAILEQVDQDGMDLYSHDLAQGLYSALSESYGKLQPLPGKLREALPEVLLFFGEEEKGSPNENNGFPVEARDLSKQVYTACRTNKAEVLVYTGRTTFLNVLSSSYGKWCNEQPVQILAGDEVAVTIAEPGEWTGPQMNFVSLTDASKRNLSGYTPIDAVIKKLPEIPPVVSFVHARLAYDALSAVTSSLDVLRQQQPSATIGSQLDVAAGVHYNLRDLPSINGPTGKAFSFEPSDTGQLTDRPGGQAKSAGRAGDYRATPRDLWLFAADPEKVQERGRCTVTPLKVSCRRTNSLPAD